MERFSILQMDQFYKVVLGGKKITGAKELKKLRGWGIRRTLRIMAGYRMRGRLTQVPSFQETSLRVYG